MELPPTHGEERDGMVWRSFDKLDETFGLTPTAQGYWEKKVLGCKDALGELNSFYGKKHTQETKDRISKARSQMTKPFMLDGVIYQSEAEAAEKLGCTKPNIAYHKRKRGIYLK